jgi:hypothetical protein
MNDLRIAQMVSTDLKIGSFADQRFDEIDKFYLRILFEGHIFFLHSFQVVIFLTKIDPAYTGSDVIVNKFSLPVFQ